jgi:type II secretory pathway pseudopilin PulG
MKRGKSGGFTIVEILIVLTVSMALFLSAVLLINGKQNETSFNQAIHSVQTQLQQIVNDVGSGYYPNNGTIACTSSGGKPLLSSTGSDSQGTNQDCLFLGKVVQFAVGVSDPEIFNVYTVTGLKDSSSGPTTDLTSAQARLIAQGTGDPASVPDVFDSDQLQYGLTVSKMYYNGVTGNSISAVGFTSNLASLSAGDGSQQVNVIAIPNTTLHTDKVSAVKQIDDNLTSSVMNPTGGVQICFNSGGTKQSGLISIGDDGQLGTIDLTIFDSPGCTNG